MHLQTSAGPVIARSSQVYFADGPLPDILLGRPILLSLGLNVEQQLCDLADRQKPVAKAKKFLTIAILSISVSASRIMPKLKKL